MDHVTSASIVEMTTPVSENEISFLDDDDDDEMHLEPTQGLIETTAPRPASTMPPVLANIAPSVVVNRVDHTPHPQPPQQQQQPQQHSQPGVPMPMPPSSSGAVRVHAYTPAHPVVARTMTGPPSGPIRMPTDNLPVVAQTYPREPTAFPIAPREWRENKATGQLDPNEGRHKRMIVGGLAAMAVIAIVLLATGGRSAPAEAAGSDPDVTKPEPVENQPAPVVTPIPTEPAIEMRVEPPPARVPTTTAPASAPSAPTAPPAATPTSTPTPASPTLTPTPATGTSTHHHHATTLPVTTTPPPKAEPKHATNRDSALPPP
jgi:hypothetical protein